MLLPTCKVAKCRLNPQKTLSVKCVNFGGCENTSETLMHTSANQTKVQNTSETNVFDGDMSDSLKERELKLCHI